MEYAAQLPVVATALRESNVDCSMLRKLDDNSLRELGISKQVERDAALQKIGIALLGIGELPPPPMVDDTIERQFGCFDTSPGQIRVRFGAPSQSSYGHVAAGALVQKGSTAAHQLRIHAYTVTRLAPDGSSTNAPVRELNVLGDQREFSFDDQVTPSWQYQYQARAWSTAGGSRPVFINGSAGCKSMGSAAGANGWYGFYSTRVGNAVENAIATIIPMVRFVTFCCRKNSNS
eukprot:SAG31_NODE_2747_length_5147_cov_3.881933_8_plen_233_part_00